MQLGFDVWGNHVFACLLAGSLLQFSDEQPISEDPATRAMQVSSVHALKGD
jgi:hypothetical protein